MRPAQAISRTCSIRVWFMKKPASYLPDFISFEGLGKIVAEADIAFAGEELVRNSQNVLQKYLVEYDDVQCSQRIGHPFVAPGEMKPPLVLP